MPAYVGGVGGKTDTHFTPMPTLVITRNLGTSSAAEQTYIPARFLMGIMPWCLLEEFTFWQYPTGQAARARASAHTHALAHTDAHTQLASPNACDSAIANRFRKEFVR